MRYMMKNDNSLFYVCSLLEYLGRNCKVERSELVGQLGKERIKRLYKDAEILHCEPIEKIADEIISLYELKTGNYDNVSVCHYDVPDYWTIGEVYERLIEDICGENNDIDFIIDALIKVYSSWEFDTQEFANDSKNLMPSVGVSFKFIFNSAQGSYLSNKGWDQSDMTVSGAWKQMYKNVNAVSAGAVLNLGLADTKAPEITMWGDQ